MLKNIYTPLAGAIAQEKALEVISHNLANANTTGFKGDQVSFTLLEPEPYKNYPSPLPPANYKVDMVELGPFIGNDINYVSLADVSRDTTQGPATQTGSPQDLMIVGKGYLKVNTKDGIRYSRAGNLSINPGGVLATKTGDPILGAKGIIQLKSGDFEINHAGEVYQNDKLIDTIPLFEPRESKQFERVGKNYYLFTGSESDINQVSTPHLKQGYIEGSNVNIIENLTAMIVAHRSFEAYQKAVSNYDKMMELSSNSLGEVRA